MHRLLRDSKNGMCTVVALFYVCMNSAVTDKPLNTNMRKWDIKAWLYSKKQSTYHLTNTHGIVAVGTVNMPRLSELLVGLHCKEIHIHISLPLTLAVASRLPWKQVASFLPSMNMSVLRADFSQGRAARFGVGAWYESTVVLNLRAIHRSSCMCSIWVD